MLVAARAQSKLQGRKKMQNMDARSLLRCSVLTREQQVLYCWRCMEQSPIGGSSIGCMGSSDAHMRCK